MSRENPLNPHLKNLIKSNLQYIQENDFLHIYQTAFDLTSSYDCYQVAKFTNAMYDAGIDPLQYTKGIIPECFLFEDIFFPDNFTKIPDNCHGIWEQAFSGCTFDKAFPVVIPSTCLEIREYAFVSSRIYKLELNCINRCHVWIQSFNNASIYEMWLNELPMAPHFISQVNQIKYLYLPTDDFEVAERWVQNYLSRIGKPLSDKVKNIISSITGEVFFEWGK